MSSDYEKIREDNIRQYGEGTRHLAFLGRLYTDRTHFIFELLQNAEDAGASRILFSLFNDRLEVTHDGRPFNERDVRGVCGVGEGTKAEDLTQIGKFGVGFKSVYAYTTKPEIHSGDESFRVKNYVRPHAVKPVSVDESWTTLFIFVFDAIDPETARRELGTCLCSLNVRTLLFLRKIKEIEYKLLDTEGMYLREETVQDSARRVEVVGQNEDQYENEIWLIFKRLVNIPDKSGTVPVEIGFHIELSVAGDTESIKRENNTPLVVYFPTEKDTRLGFLIQGPYRTTPARDNIPKDDDWNKQLIGETAELVVESLQQLKEMGLLSVSLLAALPIRTEDFQESTNMFYPIFTRVREALKNEELLPANDGTFVSARNVKLARSAALMKLLAQDQLRALFQSDNEIKWLTEGITQDRTFDLRAYLINELLVDEFTPEKFAGNLSKEFLAEQTDEWFIRFYSFLSAQKALWRRPRGGETGGVLLNKPILRLENGSHVEPHQANNSPIAFIVDENDADTSLPIVKVKLSKNKEARNFLENDLSIPKLDIVEKVISEVLPKYQRPGEEISDEIHKQDVSKIECAYKTDSAEKKKRLSDVLCETPFILAECPNEGGRGYRKPRQVYF